MAEQKHKRKRLEVVGGREQFEANERAGSGYGREARRKKGYREHYRT